VHHAQVKGELVVSVPGNGLRWAIRSPPAHAQLRIAWWGEQGSGTVVPLHPNRGAGAAFPVRCGPKHLARYLHDMGTLTCAVEECPSGATVGQLSIEVARLDVSRALSLEALPIVSSKGKVVGHAAVALHISYSGGALSSFELNEHLAAESSRLPLYPSPTKNRGGSGGAAARPPAGKENSAGSGDDASFNLDAQAPAAGAAATAAAAAAPGAPAPQPALQPEPSADDLRLQELRQRTRERLQQLAAAKAPLDEPSHAAAPGSQPHAASQPQPGPSVASRAIGAAQAEEVDQQPGLAGPAAPLAAPGAAATSPAAAPGRPRSPQKAELLAALIARAEKLKRAIEEAAASPGTAAAMPLHLGPRLAAASSALRELPLLLAARPPPAGAGPAGSSRPQPGAPASGTAGPGLSTAAAAAALAGGPGSSAGSSEVGSDGEGDTSSSSLSGLSDVEEAMEDLLLRELLLVAPARQRRRRRRGPPLQRPGPGSGGGQVAPADASSGQVAARDGGKRQQPRQQQHPPGKPAAAAGAAPGAAEGPAVPAACQLAVTVLAAQCFEPLADGDRLHLHLRAAAGAAVQLPLPAGLQPGPGGLLAEVAVPASPSLLGRQLPTDRHLVVVELWRQAPGAAAAARQLLGMCHVPLEVPSAGAQQWHVGPAPVLASGTFSLRGLWSGVAAGELQLLVTLAAPPVAAQQPEGGSDAADEAAAAATVPPPGGTAAAVAVRHAFDVTVHSFSHLPSAAELAAAGRVVPEARFVRYCFPGKRDPAGAPGARQLPRMRRRWRAAPTRPHMRRACTAGITAPAPPAAGMDAKDALPSRCLRAAIAPPPPPPPPQPRCVRRGCGAALHARGAPAHQQHQWQHQWQRWQPCGAAASPRTARHHAAAGGACRRPPVRFGGGGGGQRAGACTALRGGWPRAEGDVWLAWCDHSTETCT
jgi:hypothetical protein